MNSELYDTWIKSHQSKDIDLADVVMSQITQQVHKPNLIKRTWENILLDLLQTKILIRACLLASGALMGFLRMAFQVYSVLFS